MMCNGLGHAFCGPSEVPDVEIIEVRYRIQIILSLLHNIRIHLTHSYGTFFEHSLNFLCAVSHFVPIAVKMIIMWTIQNFFRLKS